MEDDIIYEYKKCMKIRKTTQTYNEKMKKTVRATHLVIVLFFLSCTYLYYQPSYVQGICGDHLEQTIQQEYTHLVSTGWSNINEIQSYLQEYRENKQKSYIVLGDSIYYISEIPHLLLTSPYYGAAFRPILHVGALFMTTGQRAYLAMDSVFVFLTDSSRGIFSVQHMGDMIGNGIWVLSLHMIYLVFIMFRNVFRNNNTAIMSVDDKSWVLVRDEEYTHAVLFGDMIDIINHPIEIYEPPRLYAWIYSKLGIHNEYLCA